MTPYLELELFAFCWVLGRGHIFISFHLLGGGVKGYGSERIWKSFLKMSVYELFLSCSNTVAGGKCFNSFFFL